MEKIRIGFEMATRWTDPTMMLIFSVPYILGVAGATGYYTYKALMTACSLKVFEGKIPMGDDLTGLGMELVLATLPLVLSWIWWNVFYHTLGEEEGVDTTKYITYRDPAKAAYYKHRTIPMCEFYELYIQSRIDFNEDCEGGDCYLILHKHRQHFVNYRTTAAQLWWLHSQFLPSWLTCGRGLGHGSSSGKSIEETTKEIDEHYNKGNDVFSCIMGSAMVYTCGIFHKMPDFASDTYNGDYKASASDNQLEVAQFNKMNMICDKLMLKKGDSLLDIGCGWGTLARHAVSEYGAEAVGVTLSSEGKIYCDMASEKTGIPTEIMHCDYRLIPQDRKFDHISSIEMAEHVGIQNFVDPYLSNVKRLLKNKDSKFLMQVAGLRQGSNWQDVAWGLFMCKYVFPGADASTPLNWYVRQLEMAGFEVHSVETIGIHYAHTLHKWYDNWMSHKEEILSGQIDAISEHSKGEHLFRLNELTWAWCAIHAGQGGGTCYQILAHPCEYDFPRNAWVHGKHVSNSGATGVGTDNSFEEAKEVSSKEQKSTPKKSPKRKTTPKKSSAKKTTAKKSSAKKASAKKTPTKTPKKTTAKKTPSRAQPARNAKKPSKK